MCNQIRKIHKNHDLLILTKHASNLEFPLRLKSIKKYSCGENDLSTRAVSVQETLAKITPICKKIGVTRICDITYLDKLYIPNYTAVLPGTQDTFWVYSGKGPTRTHARASALMEAVERYCSLSDNSTKSIIRGTFSKLSKSHRKVLHPDEVVEPANSTYNDNESILDFVIGFDLIKNEEVLVPAQLVFSNFTSKPPSVLAFVYSHTNGLASGNTLEEAVCHALYEVIERDAASIADLCASSIPFTILQQFTRSLKGTNNYVGKNTEITETNFVDDPGIFPELDIADVSRSEHLGRLVRRFGQVGISLSIKDITQKDIGIPTFIASSIEKITSDYGFFALGYGTHLDTRIALMRAITELSQTRAVNIQGSRDDLKKINYNENDQIHNRKWQFMMPTWGNSLNSGNKTIMFSEIRSHVIDDLLEEIKFILDRLKKSGIKRAIIVNLTNPNVGIPVVRAIVPGLETFEVAKMYTTSELVCGKRAKSYFQHLIQSK